MNFKKKKKKSRKKPPKTIITQIMAELEIYLSRSEIKIIKHNDRFFFFLFFSYTIFLSFMVSNLVLG
jgi:hypothetical protein